jgi:REP element-mobilizing transposase RayT
MQYDPDKHHPTGTLRSRRSIRLKGYDYAEAGAYFVTICAQNRECLFGAIVDGEMRMNNARKMLARWWEELPRKFPSVELDEFVVMPNHFHGIVTLADGVGADLRVCPVPQGARTAQGACVTVRGARVTAQGAHVTAQGAHVTVRGAHVTAQGAHPGAPLRRLALGEIVQWFKTMTTNEYIRGVKQNGWTPFPGKLWQRNYYEHIIRNENDLNRIREYIFNNPANWANDDENPQRQ